MKRKKAKKIKRPGTPIARTLPMFRPQTIPNKRREADRNACRGTQHTG